MRARGESQVRVSVIIPCFNEALCIGACLDSVIANEFPREELEVLVVDGQSTDGTREIVSGYGERHTFIRMLDNAERRTPQALNIGIRAANGEVIIRMDAHATYEQRYIAKCVDTLEKEAADNVGGIMITKPQRDTRIGRAIVAVLGSRFGVGNSQFRVHPREPTVVDTVFGGCYRRTVFDRLGLFNEKLLRGQDIEFNLRLKAAGGRTLLVPGIVSSYFARTDYLGFVRHNFINGVWAILPFLHSRVMPVRAMHLVPLAFVSVMLLTGIATVFGVPYAGSLLLFIAASYLAACFTSTCIVARRLREASMLVLLPLCYASLHLPYGAGSVVGVAVSFAHVTFGGGRAK